MDNATTIVLGGSNIVDDSHVVYVAGVVDDSLMLVCYIAAVSETARVGATVITCIVIDKP